MSIRNIGRILFALTTAALLSAPAFAQYYPNTVVVNPGYVVPAYGAPYYGAPYYGAPCYNNYGYRGYAPCYRYGYHHREMRDMAIGAGIGGAIGLMAAHHGHRYYY